MQSTNSEKPIEFWWPHPDAFEDLTVEDAENGFELSAPDDTECAEWLAYWNQDEAHHKVFEDEFIRVLTHYVNKTLEIHGENEDLPDGSESDREQAQVHGTGTLAEHEPGRNLQPSS